MYFCFMEIFMKIEIKKFGEILVSRPAGSEAFHIIESYLNPDGLVNRLRLFCHLNSLEVQNTKRRN